MLHVWNKFTYIFHEFTMNLLHSYIGKYTIHMEHNMDLKSTTQISSEKQNLPATPSSQLHGKQNVHSEGCYFECHQRPTPSGGAL